MSTRTGRSRGPASLDDAFRKNLESAPRFGNPLLVQVCFPAARGEASGPASGLQTVVGVSLQGTVLPSGLCEKGFPGSPAVRTQRFFTAGAVQLVPGWGPKIPQAARHSPKRKAGIKL